MKPWFRNAVNALLMSVFFMSCTSYLGVASHGDGKVIITYATTFVFFSESGVAECLLVGDDLKCHELGVTITSHDQAAGSMASGSSDYGSSGRHVIIDVEAVEAHAEQAVAASKKEEASIEQVVETAEPIQSFALGSGEALIAANEELPAFVGRLVRIDMKDGARVVGVLSGIAGVDLVVKTQTGTWIGGMLDAKNIGLLE